MTTTSSAVPAKAPESPRPAQAQPHPSEKKSADADRFASLLDLASDAAATPPLQAEARTDDSLDPADAPLQTEAQDAGPLAALLAWATPSAAAPPPAASDAPRAGHPDGAAASAEPAQPGEGAVSIEGMTRVDEPATGLPPGPARPASAAARPAMVVWQRGAAPGAGQPIDARPPQAAGSATAAAAPPSAAALAQVRSTVALDERFGALQRAGGLAPASAATAPEAAGETALARAGGALDLSAALPRAGGGDAAPGLASATGGGTGEAPTDGAGSEDPAAPDPQAHDAHGADAADADPERAATVAHWGTQHLRHASVRVGSAGAGDAIDIQLAMKGQEVQVAFQSDNPDARASLREHAGEALADLLHRSGIQLAGVSVGAQGQPSPQGGNTDTLHRPTAGRRGEAPPSPAVGKATPPGPRADGSRPLDVYA